MTTRRGEILLLSLVLAACTGDPSGGDPRGGAAALPGPVPSGVTFLEPGDAPPAPEFSLTLMDGTSVTGSELWTDRPVLLFFFASWCGVCAEQQSTVTSIAERYGDAIAVVGIAGEDEADAVAEYLDEHQVPYPVGIDDDLDVWRLYAAEEPPVVVVVAKGGRVLRGWPGGTTRDVIDDAIAELVRMPS